MSDLASTSEKDGGLLPCPLCGSAFRISQEPHDNHPVAGMFYVYHDYGPLGSAARSCIIDVARHFDTEAEAIAAWNRRSGAALASPAPADSGEPVGYVFLNPDTGIEFSVNHPVESGEVDDAQDIRHETEFEAELVRQLNNAVATISTLRETVAGSHRDYQSAWTRAEEAEEKLRSAHPPAESAGSPSTSGVGVRERQIIHELAADIRDRLSQEEGSANWRNAQRIVELSRPRAGSSALSAAPSDPSRDTQPALLSTDETKEGGNG